MSRKLFVAMAIMSAALIGTASAAVENIRVSGDINTQAVTRNLSLGSTLIGEGVATKDSEDFLFSQVRLRFDVDMTEGVSAIMRLLNENVWGIARSATDDVDLDLAYIELQEFFYEPLTLVVGRQLLRYGNALIIGDPDTNQLTLTGNSAFGDLSLRKSFDAIRAIIDYSPYTVDVVFAKISEGVTNVEDDVTLYGVNVAYNWDSYDGVSELYTFSRLSEMDELVDREDSVVAVGARTQFNPNDHLTLGLEAAHQFGDYLTPAPIRVLEREAWAAQFVSEYRFLDDHNAKLGLIYAWLSGDVARGKEGEFNGWNPMFEDQAIGELANAFLPNTGFQYVALSGSMMPREDLTLGTTYLYAYATAPLGGNIIPGATGSPMAGNLYAIDGRSKGLAQEINVYAILDYTEDVQINLNTAYLIPGSAFSNSNDSSAYSVRLGMNVGF